jgi:hypothetical protein
VPEPPSEKNEGTSLVSDPLTAPNKFNMFASLYFGAAMSGERSRDFVLAWNCCHIGALVLVKETSWAL